MTTYGSYAKNHAKTPEDYKQFMAMPEEDYTKLVKNGFFSINNRIVTFKEAMEFLRKLESH
jgi:hypothetical protein